MKPRRTRVAAYALIHEENELLLCRLSKIVTGAVGKWTLPGGGIEFGESPHDAVIREVEEETGLQVEVGDVASVDSTFDTSGNEDFHSIRIVYFATVMGGELRHEIEGSTDLCEWHRLHPTPDIPLVDLSTIGIGIAQQRWPLVDQQA